MHCLTAWGRCAVQLLLCTATPPGGSGQWNSCNALPHCLPHCLGAVGIGTPAMHCLTTWGRWAVQLLLCTATPPGGSGQCNSWNTLPGGSGQWDSCNTLPHCLGAVGSATPAMHSHIAWGRWGGDLLQRTASLPWGQWAVELLQCVGPPAGGMGSPAQEVVAAERGDLLQRTATLPGRSGQWNSCHALPHCLGAVGSGTRGGRDNGPYADSFPLRCHFQGGGGGGAGSGGGGQLEGGGGAPDPYIYGVKWPRHHTYHFEVQMQEQKKIATGGGGGMVGGTFV